MSFLYQTLLKDELTAVQDLMMDALQDLPQAVKATVTALVRQGGKQLRPALVLLACHICEANLNRALPVAAAVELLHTATLIHDDLIDQAPIRRGAATLSARESPAATILTGDLIFAWAARLASQGRSLPLTKRFAETLVTICKGELDQKFGQDTLPTLETYEARIYAKTASLFALATESGALLGDCDADKAQRARQFGKLLGEAFQISDDVLDITGDAGTMGKPVGNDLRQGVLTLPVLYYLEEHPGDPLLNEQIQAIAAHTANETVLHTLLEAVRNSTAIERALAQAEARIITALDLLAVRPDSPYRAAMEEIAHFAVQRRY